MPQAIAHPVWKMVWTTTLKTGPWSNKPRMGRSEKNGTGGLGGTHEDLDEFRWKNMGAGCTSPGPSALLSAMSCDTVGLCGNCDKHGGAESRPKYEAVKQSPSRAIIINPPSPSSNVETSRASGCVACSLVQSAL